MPTDEELGAALRQVIPAIVREEVRHALAVERDQAVEVLDPETVRRLDKKLGAVPVHQPSGSRGARPDADPRRAARASR